MIADPKGFLALLFAQDAARVRALAPTSALAWRDLSTTCAAVGASGLLHAVLRRTRTTDLAPEDVRAELRLAHATNAAHNLALEAEADRVLVALREAKVIAAPMKGVALFRERVVDDLGARPTGDFDLVTRRADREVVLRALRDLGYDATFQEMSWKHLPAVTRGDLSIEVHEIAYWSPTTRAVFGAEHLAIADRATRLGRLAALQIHHLVLGSPPDAGLTVRTLADLDAFLQLARRDPDVKRELGAAARAADVETDLAAADALLAEARGEATVLGLPATTRDRDSVIGRLQARPTDPRVEMLAHALRIVPVQPWEVTREMLSLLVFPPAEHVAGRVDRASGSWAVGLARLRRPFQLLVRVARTLPATLRARPGRRGGATRS